MPPSRYLLFMDNYDLMIKDAQRRFLQYPVEKLLENPGVRDEGAYIKTDFFSCPVRFHKESGQGEIRIAKDWEKLDFSQTLSVLDYICDRKCTEKAHNVFCPVGSLPGIFVGGSGLMMAMPAVASAIERSPDAFRTVCEKLGGRKTGQGDIGYRLPIFPDLFMELKFYFGDEEFSPQLTLLWDENSLSFVRYETLYYIAGALGKVLLRLFNEAERG